jgi:Virulence factor BrkB
LQPTLARQSQGLHHVVGLYIGKQGLESTYGASASIVVVVIWVYYSAQIVLFGAELTHVRARQRASAADESPVEAGEDDDWRGTARGLRPARRPAAASR